MKKQKVKIVTVAVFATISLCSVISRVHAEVKVLPFFSDGMILQRESPVVIFGQANREELVPLPKPRRCPLGY